MKRNNNKKTKTKHNTFIDLGELKLWEFVKPDIVLTLTKVNSYDRV